ncbi:putative PEP-binding protein [Gordonia shandongensis]|uniref:putative PEP-binding protein n=1 Tax=Gordonia shandongensis TaxID=376351 RepID=UPI000402E39C|nr:putative PEP-binding protein [Gordonia shandongensis]
MAEHASYGAHTVVPGTPVVNGLGYGRVVRPRARPTVGRIDESPVAESDRSAERDRLAHAVDAVATRLTRRASRSVGAAAEVLNATATLARDRGWAAAAGTAIDAGATAESAAVAATARFTAMFADLGGVMADRITDLEDVRDRVVAELRGEPEPGITIPDEPSILIAADLAPADVADLDPSRVVGIGLSRGGPSGHTAIIARQLDIPCVVAARGLDGVVDGGMCFVDGHGGTVGFDPDPALIGAAVDAAREAAQRTAQWRGAGRTSDGHAVALRANVSDGRSARVAARYPVDGVGLFRTELAFLERAAEPTVEEQAALYRDVIEIFDGHTVVIRTLDAGSDKPLGFIDHPTEENPALGIRGDRIAQRHPAIRDAQLDAIARAADGASRTPWVMAPMVATPTEARDFARRVRARGLVAGVMIEVPSAALLADAIAAEVDFVSIGTNDLTQYTMAADRSSPELAALTDPWQPAVLSLISRVCDAGRARNVPVGVCGEAAADPLLACVLVGLGVSSLSAAPAAVPAVGVRLGDTTMAACRDAARGACAARDAHGAREAARTAVER